MKLIGVVVTLCGENPPNAERRVTFQDDPDERADDQRMKLRSKRGMNYRALAGLKSLSNENNFSLIDGRGMCCIDY